MYAILLLLGSALAINNADYYSLYNSLEAGYETLVSNVENYSGTDYAKITTNAWYQSYLSQVKALEASAGTDTELSSLMAEYASEIAAVGGVATAAVSSVTSDAKSALDDVESAVSSTEKSKSTDSSESSGSASLSKSSLSDSSLSADSSSSSTAGANLLVPAGAALGALAVALL